MSGHFLSRHRYALLSLIVLIAVTLVFLWRITFSGMILARGDVYSYFYPLWDARSAVFRAGHIPLWSPDVFMGAPLLANSQLGTFYPPNWLVTPFDAPTAITLSLLAHTFWAMLGVYLLTRRTLGLDRIAAILAGVLFGLGGYLGGQSEHINQLQALSWMPWLFLVGSFQLTVDGQKGNWARYGAPLSTVLIFGVCVALQLLAGHPQTVFITLVGLGVYGIGRRVSSRPRWRLSFNVAYFIRFVVLIALGGILGLVLAAPQLIPTLELAGLGNRGGGLDPQKVLAFSFTPLLMGRGLLPSYDGLLFGEYIAYSGVIGLGLAIIGVTSYKSQVASSQTSVANRQSPDELSTQHSVLSTLPFTLLIILGFFFALGAFNPLNWLLASLPGFSLFRVPARWMALESLGVAALAGVGLQSLKQARPRLWVLAIVVVVMVGLAAASTLAGKQAVDVIGPAVPTLRSWIGWGVALITLLMLIAFSWRLGVGRTMALLTAAAMLELFLASQIMPINLTAPKDVYSASRFTIRQLQTDEATQIPPGRMLSISPLEFDPGDKDALNTRYADLGMDALSTRIALVATKLREVIGPNLGMKWGIPGIDGFDGGLLPTRYYTAFSSLLLPAGSDPSTDGRLREMLALPECRGACIPDLAWLNLSNTRYLITDKTADVVNDGVFYDTSLSLEMPARPDYSIAFPVEPTFTATAIDALFSTDSCIASMTCAPHFGTLPPNRVEPLGTFALAHWVLPEPTKIAGFILSTDVPITLHALTLVDTRAKVFQQVTLPPWKRILSSDIKLYENMNATPRAFFVPENSVHEASDTAASLVQMRQAVDEMNANNMSAEGLAQAFVVSNDAEQNRAVSSDVSSAKVTISTYTPERVEVQVDAGDQAGTLVLSDAYYPGWTATVNGTLTAIYRTNIMFRGVPVPKGESTVIFAYQPWWWPVVFLAGLAAWLLVGIMALWLIIKQRRRLYEL